MSTRERAWPVAVALVALSAVPATADALRLVQLVDDAVDSPADPPFDGFPLPLTVHIAAAATYALGVLQSTSSFRRRYPAWRRRAGGDLAKGAGWVVNLAGAEWGSHRPPRQRSHDRRAEVL